MKTSRTSPALLLSALVLASGCNSSSPAGPTANVPARPPFFTPSASPPTSFGTIAGVIHFSGTPPKRLNIDMSMDPGCAFGGDNMSEPYVIDHGRVANVYVYVKSGAQETLASVGTQPALLDQKGCKFTPHVLAVQQGAGVSFHNADSTMHNIHVVPTEPGNAALDISQPPGAPAEVKAFNAPETMVPVRCNNHPWMNAFINVAPNPFFAVTGPDGSFSIPHLPPGHYVLAAVHEKMGEQDIPVTVLGGTTTQADLTFTTK